MILIADSGSTKTDWCLVDEGTDICRIKTKGLNPYFLSFEEISDELKNSLYPIVENKKLKAVYFYGAGCIYDKVETVRNAIAHSMKVNSVEVSSDLLAAARSLCGRNPGIACILGTGSNACFYDGNCIKEHVSPLGFILGDEGSGAVLGKLLIGDMYKGVMDDAIKEKFQKRYDITLAEVIDKVYRQPFPNRFLAGLTPFICENIDNPRMHELVLNSFISFITRNTLKLGHNDYEVNFVGSIAFFFRNILDEAAEATGIKIGKILKSPMDGLIDYHS